MHTHPRPLDALRRDACARVERRQRNRARIDAAAAFAAHILTLAAAIAIGMIWSTS